MAAHWTASRRRVRLNECARNLTNLILGDVCYAWSQFLLPFMSTTKTVIMSHYRLALAKEMATFWRLAAAAPFLRRVLATIFGGLCLTS